MAGDTISSVGTEFISQARGFANKIGDAVISVGEAAVIQIKQSTASGVNANGQPFHSYSGGYARRYKGGRIQPVTFRRTGSMMDSVKVQKGRGGVTVESRLGGGQIRGPVRGRIQSINDVDVRVVVEDPKAKWYGEPLGDQKGRHPFAVSSLWVSEEMDRRLRGIAKPNFTRKEINIG